MDLADLDWRLVREEAWDGPTNMALDEVAAETAAAGGPATVRVYRWTPSTLSLGYRQAPETVDWARCERDGVTVTRRPTGGGGIYHDSYGDVSYSIVAPADALPGDLMDSYELLCRPVLDAFRRMGVDAGFASEERPAVHPPACYLRELHPAHDVVVEGAPVDAGVSAAEGATDGGASVRKISGNAQYRRKDAVIQHGSLTYDVRAARHLATFADPGVGPDGFRERVTGIREQAGIDREAAVSALEDALREWVDADEGTWRPDEVAAARERAREKYATDAWTRDREDPLA